LSALASERSPSLSNEVTSPAWHLRDPLVTVIESVEVVSIHDLIVRRESAGLLWICKSLGTLAPLPNAF